MSVKGVGKNGPKMESSFVTKDERLIAAIEQAAQDKTEEEKEKIRSGLIEKFKFGRSEASLYGGPVERNEELQT